MRTRLVLSMLLLAALMVAATALSKGPKPDQKNGKATSVTVTRVDNGSCGNPWATDTVKSDFKAKRNDDGSYRFTRRDRGTFVTTGSVSPGKCDSSGKHGTAVVAGVKGKLHGYIVGTVTGGTFNPNGCVGTPSPCNTRSSTVIALFGPGADAHYSCNQDSKDCRFDYEYSAPAKDNPKLLYHHWSDKGKGAGTMLDEKMKGDIATS
jgi:hypothetical protein